MNSSAEFVKTEVTAFDSLPGQDQNRYSGIVTKHNEGGIQYGIDKADHPAEQAALLQTHSECYG